MLSNLQHFIFENWHQAKYKSLDNELALIDSLVLMPIQVIEQIHLGAGTISSLAKA